MSSRAGPVRISSGIQGTQNPAEVVQNAELIAVIANQQAAGAMRKAADALAGGADAEAAVQHFASAKQFLSLCAAPELASEAAALLDETRRKDPVAGNRLTGA